MDELAALLEVAFTETVLFHFVKLLLDEILYCFHIMVSYLLDVLYTLCVLLREVLVDTTKLWEERLVELSKLRQWELTKGNEILYLYTNTITDKCVL